MNEGIYEQLISQLVAQKIAVLDKDFYEVRTVKIDKEEAAIILTQHLSKSLKHAFTLIKGENILEHQIEIANKIINFLKDELKKEDFKEDIIDVEGKILKAVFRKVDAHFSDLDLHLKEITPYTRLTHSELFTGGNQGLSLESELKKEILSANKIDLLVSFIKFKGIIILKKNLRNLQNVVVN